MKKLCIIVGAGASKYMVGTVSASLSLINQGWQPPLASELFTSRATFDVILRNHPKAHSVVARLKNRISNTSTSLEKELTLISKSTNPEDIRSLKFITYYLWDIFKNISLNYLNGSPSNYDILIGSILSRDIEVMFLTLNYDLFIEESLKKSGVNIAFDDINKYISKDRKWQLIKLHGSINWGRQFIHSVNNFFDINSYEIEKLDLRAGLDKNITIAHLTGGNDAHLPEGRGKTLYPAIAIPVEDNYDFVCPPEHLDEAKKFLEQCKSFLVLGCRVKDENVKHLLGGSVKDVEMLRIVNGQTTRENITALGELLKIKTFQKNWIEPQFNGGFNEFLKEGQLEKFLDNLK